MWLKLFSSAVQILFIFEKEEFQSPLTLSNLHEENRRSWSDNQLNGFWSDEITTQEENSRV